MYPQIEYRNDCCFVEYRIELLTPIATYDSCDRFTSHEGALSSKSAGTEPVTPDSMLPTLFLRLENGLNEAARIVRVVDGAARCRRLSLHAIAPPPPPFVRPQ